MSALFITSCYLPPLEGGSVVFLYNLVANFPPAEVMVLTNGRPNDAAFDDTQSYRIIRNRIVWRDFTKIAQGRVLAEWAIRLSCLFRQERVDVIHAGDLFLSGITAWFAHHLWGIPYLLYVYAEELNTQLHRRDRFWGKLKGRIYQRVIKDAAGYIAVSDYTAGLLCDFGVSRDRILKIIPMVIPSPAPEPAQIQSLRSQYGLFSDQKVILTVGRLIPRKGQEQLIRAMQKVLPIFPEARLLIAGRGPELARLRTLTESLKIQNEVVFAGFVSEDDLPALYELCDIFAMPHRELGDGDTEGCPTVFLEAAEHGKPAIGGLAGGAADAIIDGETGLLVDGNRVDDVAGAILCLLRDPELRMRLGNAGRRRVQNELRPAQGARKVLAFSQSIATLGNKQ